MGMLRALWDHNMTQNEVQLRIYLSDHALVRSIKSPPNTYTNEWLHETVQLQLHPFASVLHPLNLPPALGVFLACYLLRLPLASPQPLQVIRQIPRNMGSVFGTFFNIKNLNNYEVS